jgi:hypothetical protein
VPPQLQVCNTQVAVQHVLALLRAQRQRLHMTTRSGMGGNEPLCRYARSVLTADLPQGERPLNGLKKQLGKQVPNNSTCSMLFTLQLVNICDIAGRQP